MNAICRAHPDCFGIPVNGVGLCDTHRSDPDAPPVSGYCRCAKPFPLPIVAFRTWQCGRCYRPLPATLEARLGASA